MKFSTQLEMYEIHLRDVDSSIGLNPVIRNGY